MRATILSLLLLAVPAAAGPPALEIPETVTPADGLAIVEPKTDAKAVSYVGLDGAKAIPTKLLADKRTLVVPTGGLPPGSYRFQAVASLNDEHTVRAFAVVVPGEVPVPAAPTTPAPRPAPGRTPAGFKLSAEPATAAATCRVSWSPGGGTGYGGSGTCVGCEGGRCLVLTCAHIFDGASLPVACSVQPRDGGRLSGSCVVADRGKDLALVVADGEMPAAEVAAEDPPEGEVVRHWGIGSGGGEGRVIAMPGVVSEHSQFASSAPSVSGDSGAGLFDSRGRLVAVNCGRHGTSARAPQRGTPIRNVLKFLLCCKGHEGGPLERLKARIAARRGEAGTPPPAGSAAPAPCPGGVCPPRTAVAEATPSAAPPASWYDAKEVARYVLATDRLPPGLSADDRRRAAEELEAIRETSGPHTLYRQQIEAAISRLR